MENITYRDQDYTEIYDLYDLKAKEKVPQAILNAKILSTINPYSYNNYTVYIEYPVDGGIFSLGGHLGKASWYEEMGKKAFLRGGSYKHPEKNISSKIEYMSPYKYIEKCAEIFISRGFDKSTPERLIKQRTGDYDLEQVFGPYTGDIFYPVIDYKDKGQEGLHRAVYAMMLDIEEIPVIIIY